MKHVNILSLTVCILFFSGCRHSPEKLIGMKIYEYDGDFNVLTGKWKEMGINTAFLSKELASNKVFRQILKVNNIGVYLIFPVFHNPEILKQDSTLYAVTDKGGIAKEDWVGFVCPSRASYRKIKIAEAEEMVKELQPDGLSIDFIRQFVYWEMIYPDRSAETIDIACFCDSCINDFLFNTRIIMPDSCSSTRQKSAFILSKYKSEWNNYRCDMITSMAEEISHIARIVKPDIKINIHAVPWRDGDFEGANIRVAAQDLKDISTFADYISPMCYSQMLKRSPDWIASVVTEMDKKAHDKVLPSIQVFPYYINDPFTPEDLKRCFNAALKEPSRGVVFFSWPLFEKDPERMEIIRQSL